MTTWVEQDNERIKAIEARIERIKTQEDTQTDYDEWLGEQREYAEMQEGEYTEWWDRMKEAQIPLTITRYGVCVHD